MTAPKDWLNATSRATCADTWRARGLALGYPACCVEDFVSRACAPSPHKQRLAGQGSGYVPCPACAERVLNGKPLADLIDHSKRPWPFKVPPVKAPTYTALARLTTAELRQLRATADRLLRERRAAATATAVTCARNLEEVLQLSVACAKAGRD